MKQYELPMTRDYVRNWTPVEAIREIIQNALDYCNGTLYAKIDGTQISEDDGLYRIQIDSPGASLESRTLLLGCTSKADDKNSIGSFGEGYKIALLVLAREGIDVSIYHSGIIWRPSFTRSVTFGEDVLTITEEVDDVWKPSCVSFVICGLTLDTIEKVKENTLQLQADCIGKFHRVAQGDILLEKPGKLFINGLFVADTGLKFGYNVKPEYLRLERDRQTVCNFDLKFLTKDMWFETGLISLVAGMIEEGVDDLQYAEYSCPQLVKEACYKAFIERHPGAIAATSQKELDELVKRGMMHVVIVNNTYKSIIDSHPSYKRNIAQSAAVSPRQRLIQ